MLSPLPLLCALALTPAAPGRPTPAGVESRFEQVAPRPASGKEWERSPGQTRAVVLIHGFYLHLRPQSVSRADFRVWQRPESTLVRELARHADVYAFGYGQDAPLERVVAGSGLGAAVARLRGLGYREVVLVGHSAGGLVARQFVEDNPDSAVTKVIQVCSPNGGSPSTLLVRVSRSQQAFLDCLSAKGRERCLKARADRRIPQRVQFVCVVGTGKGGGDGVVACPCQWTEDLQAQGIPAVAVPAGHREVVRSLKGARALAELVAHDQPRWSPAQVRKARKEILGP